MRIALVRQRYNPFGGAERFIERALKALERNGAKVTLITREWAGDERDVVRVNPPYVGSLWRDAGFARAARTAWTRGNFDLVQSHERIAGCNLYRAGDGVHRQWLDLRLERMSGLERSRIRANPYHRYVCKAERRMFEHARLQAVICNSRMVREDVLRHFRIEPAKLHVVYNGVELEHFHPRQRAALREDARAAFGCAPQDVLFAFVGSGFERKGLATAIEALARSGDARLRLAVAGRDRHAPRYAAQAARAGVADRVRLAGGLDDVRPLYAAADCFILPTLYDPFPNAALEALAMGVPVIVSKRCGAAELISAGENGWLCEPHDAAGLADLLKTAAGSAGKPELSQAARATAEGFGIDEMAARLTALYATLGARAA